MFHPSKRRNSLAFYALYTLNQLQRASISCIIAALVLLGKSEIAFAQPATWGQCSCPVTESPNAGSARYSTITNASLCVNAQSHTPICRIEVRCLQDGTGPDCGNLAQSNWSPNELQSAIYYITTSTFESREDLYPDLINIIISEISESEWPELSDCLDGFKNQNSVEPDEREAGVWRNVSGDVSCVHTSSGWLHVVISLPNNGTTSDLIARVSYQFSPPE